MKKILIVMGTRPEGIKMSPLVKTFNADSFFETKVCVTGQHRELLNQTLEMFGIKPDYNLNIMAPNQTLTGITCKILEGMEKIFLEWKPDMILVQGDTTTVMAASLAAFYQKIDVGHVEAGLRTGDIFAPWPEEMNRSLTARLACLHFAPTNIACNNLLREGIARDKIHITGNTVIDALHDAVKIIDTDKKIASEIEKKFSFLDPAKKMILVTGHRRENFGKGLRVTCEAISELAKRDDVQFVYPMHMNPNVTKPVNEILGHCENVFLIEPQDYITFVYLMRRCYLVMTDSGGIQEEAPALGKPVVVMRQTSERPEAATAGTAVLAGTNFGIIVKRVTLLMEDSIMYARMSRAVNPYGDGTAAKQIFAIVKKYYDI